MGYHTSWTRWFAGAGLILVLLLLPSKAQAREGWRGWCEVGNQSVITSGISSTTKVERSFPQCTVTVFIHGGGLATIYRDNNGTQRANPFQANLDGSWIFYADDGRYDIQTSGANFPTPFTYLDVLLCDPFVAGSVCASGSGGGGHNLLSTTHLDTIPFSPPVRGDIITAQNQTSPSLVTPSWARLPLGTAGQFLTSTGIDTVWGSIVGGNNITVNNSGSTTTISLTAGTLKHGISFTIGAVGGTALTAGSTTTDFISVPFACTINRYTLLIDAGTITVKFWKIALGTAVPTSSNSINTSGVGISSGTAITSTTLSDFTTTSIAANDALAMNVTAAATAAYVNGVLSCAE